MKNGDNMENKRKRNKVELLLPAGNLETLKVAIRYGADAVYIGGQAYGLRAKADNFSIEDMKAAAEYAHAHGKKVYLTANIYAHNYDIDGVRKYFAQVKDTGIDAVLVSDPGMFMLAREVMPDMELHISTQANNTNYLTFQFWNKMGAKRVVTARELSLKEIGEIRDNIPDDMEIESFIHGAMCISYSGRCLLSNYFTGRDANRGACTHPCRWKYHIVEETRPGEYLPVNEDERGTYIFNSKDLCMIEHVPEMIEAGIDSFKIEGRMKTALYVAAVARTYRKAIDDYLESEEKYKANLDYYRTEIAKCTYRQFTTGFYFGKPDETAQIYDSNTYLKNCTYIGNVENVTEDGVACFEQKNKFSVGENIECMDFDGTNINGTVEAIYDIDGNPMEAAPHPKQPLKVKFSCDVKPGMILRRVEDADNSVR